MHVITGAMNGTAVEVRGSGTREATHGTSGSDGMGHEAKLAWIYCQPTVNHQVSERSRKAVELRPRGPLTVADHFDLALLAKHQFAKDNGGSVRVEVIDDRVYLDTLCPVQLDTMLVDCFIGSYQFALR